jgi:uncharacterized integral membrane protein (TIGR00697 family)
MTSRHKYYDLLVVMFSTVLLCSNLIGAGKVATITLPYFGPVDYGAGILFFPFSYLFGDILTEVYGYAHDRRAVWACFGALIFAALMASVVISIPPAPTEDMALYQTGMETIFGNTWRIVLASIIAFWSGSLVNSYVLAKLKILTKGKHLWLRIIGSTATGEMVDASLFFMIAFYGLWPIKQLFMVAVTQYLLQTGWEVVMTPITYRVVAWLKKQENQDYYDYQTNFTPFKVEVE